MLWFRLGVRTFGTSRLRSLQKKGYLAAFIMSGMALRLAMNLAAWDAHLALLLLTLAYLWVWAIDARFPGNVRKKLQVCSGLDGLSRRR